MFKKKSSTKNVSGIFTYKSFFIAKHPPKGPIMAPHRIPSAYFSFPSTEMYVFSGIEIPLDFIPKFFMLLSTSPTLGSLKCFNSALMVFSVNSTFASVSMRTSPLTSSISEFMIFIFPLLSENFTCLILRFDSDSLWMISSVLSVHLSVPINISIDSLG